MASVTILDARENVSLITGTSGPTIELPEGQETLAFNADLDMAGVPDNLRPWAVRWGPTLRANDAMVINSQLDKREWAELDREVYAMVKLRQNALADLASAGLVKPISLAVILSQWRKANERIAPTVSIDGESSAEADRTDRRTYSVPVPMFRTDYSFGQRELLASRALGQSVETFEAGEAAAAIVEAQENMLFNGETEVVIAGSTIPGLTTFTPRDTTTATLYGGGDFGTVGNGYKTALGMIAALAAKRYHGPFTFYVAPAQYLELLNYYTDGSAQTDLMRILTLPQVNAVKPGDFLTDENAVMVQLSGDVIDYQEALGVENREWAKPDGTRVMMAVLAAGVHRLKQDTAGNTGIAHATGC
jgi:uncharacterized linocin/CFP29 family protein